MGSTELELPGRSVDLTEVQGMDDDEYEGLLYYAKQFDVPVQVVWVQRLEKARGGEADWYEEPEVEEAVLDPETADEYSEDWTAAQVAEWVGDDVNRARAALESEYAREEPRKRLSDKLTRIVESATA